MNNIIDLQETRPNCWKAKYRGNYGTYTIKMKIDGKNTRDFSCSCPSDYYPCRHIPIVKEAISKRLSESKAKRNEGLFKRTIRHLQKFNIRRGLYNTPFQQAVLLKFTPQQKLSEDNHYSIIIRSALKNTDIDYEDICDRYDGFIEIEALSQWLNKANEHLERENGREAVLIVKACIEEYADWLRDNDFDLDCYLSEEHLEEPFAILEKAYENSYINAGELLDYCKKEAKKKKYDRGFVRMFDDLIMTLTEDTDPKAFLAIQDKLFKDLPDKSSFEAKQILERKIDFYKKQGDTQAARRVMEENPQIESFRQEIVKKMIVDKRYEEAKKLINKYIEGKGKNNFSDSYNPCWDEYLLEIAKEENNTKDIRKISHRFIERSFHLIHYRTYKSTFAKEEWPAEMEKIIKHYQKRSNWYNSNITTIFAEEKLADRLLAYLKKYPHPEAIDIDHKYTVAEFPEETIALFRKAIDEYMKDTGRDIYENTVRYFQSMIKIKGGKEVVRQMIDQYKTQYRSRKAMIEIFDRFSKSML